MLGQTGGHKLAKEEVKAVKTESSIFDDFMSDSKPAEIKIKSKATEYQKKEDGNVYVANS